LPAVDALVEGALETHLERRACEPRVDLDAWRSRALRDGLQREFHAPTRGQVACAATHCAAWRWMLDRSAPHLLVLEDDAEVSPGVAEAIALSLAELPADYDLLYLHVPPRFFRDDDGVRAYHHETGRELRHVCAAYECWSLTAYVVSAAGAAKLLDLCVEGLDAPLMAAANRAALDGRLKAFAPRTASAVDSRGALALAASPKTADRFFPSNVLLTPTWAPAAVVAVDEGGVE